MTGQASRVLEQALALPPEDRARVADELLSSLDPPDQRRIDALWALEAEDRLDAYERGEMEAFPAEQVLDELRKKHKR